MITLNSVWVRTQHPCRLICCRLFFPLELHFIYLTELHFNPREDSFSGGVWPLYCQKPLHVTLFCATNPCAHTTKDTAFTLWSDEHSRWHRQTSDFWWIKNNMELPVFYHSHLVTWVKRRELVTFLVCILFCHCRQAQRFHKFMEAVVGQALSIHEVKHDWTEHTELFKESRRPTAGLADPGVKPEDVVSQCLIPEHLLHCHRVRQDVILQPPQS